MKKVLFLIICIFAFASMPKALIEKGFEITKEKDSVCDEYSYNSIHKSKDGNFFILGFCNKKDINSRKPFIEKRDKNGKLIWRSKTPDDVLLDAFSNMFESKNGDIYVTNISVMDAELNIVKFDKNGNYIYTQLSFNYTQLSINEMFDASIFDEDKDGNILLSRFPKAYKIKKEVKGSVETLSVINEKEVKVDDPFGIFVYSERLSNGNILIEEFYGNKTIILDENFNIVKSKEHLTLRFISGYISNDKIYGLYVTQDNKVILKELNSNLEEVNNINLSSLDSTMPRELLNFHDQGNIILNAAGYTQDSDFIVSYYINDKVHSGYKFDIKDIGGTQSIVLDSSNIVTLYQPAFILAGGGIIPDVKLKSPPVITTSGIINTKLLFQAKTEAEENGKIELSKTKAAYKDEISVNVKPKFGYKVIGVDVKTDDGEMITLNNNKFIMPASDVIVSVKYEKTGIINPKTGVYSVGIVFIVVLISSLISYMIIKIKENRII